MKIICIDGQYVLYPDSIKTYDSLPPLCYNVAFDKQRGFYLVQHEPLAVKEKVYGGHEKKVEKIMRAFKRSQRSLGAIASGKKGIGKSLLFRLLANKCMEEGIPVIIVDHYIPGVANYIESITQEVMVLFDEFDKTFSDVKQADGSASAQTELLGLFDGTSSGKKLFAITCNEIYRISDFLVNRPGRFHYHFRFDVPETEEIAEYIHDKLGSSEWIDKQIDEIIKFSRKVPLNYDCLRAIVFELEDGQDFREAIRDMNIVNTDSMLYDIKLIYENNRVLTLDRERVNMFTSIPQNLWMYDEKGNDSVLVTFNSRDAVFDPNVGAYVLQNDKLKISYDSCEDDVRESLKKSGRAYMTIKMCPENTIHYTV